jgi:hypothetical protein
MPRDKLPMKDAQAAKRSGELHRSVDPEVSEWGNPIWVMPYDLHLNT